MSLHCSSNLSAVCVAPGCTSPAAAGEVACRAGEGSGVSIRHVRRAWKGRHARARTCRIERLTPRAWAPFPPRRKRSHGARNVERVRRSTQADSAARSTFSAGHRGQGSLSLCTQSHFLLVRRSAHSYPTLSTSASVRLRAPCGSSGLRKARYCRHSFRPGETLRRWTSGLASGSESGERVCLSARRTRNRKTDLERPGS